MLNIDELYGIEVIVHFNKIPTEQKVKELIIPKSIPDWLEGTVIMTGRDCKKGLTKGDKVIVARDLYSQSPVLDSGQFNFPEMEVGSFKIMTEHWIAMKASAVNLVAPVPTSEEIDTQFDEMRKPINVAVEPKENIIIEPKGENL